MELRAFWYKTLISPGFSTIGHHQTFSLRENKLQELESFDSYNMDRSHILLGGSSARRLTLITCPALWVLERACWLMFGPSRWALSSNGQVRTVIRMLRVRWLLSSIFHESFRRPCGRISARIIQPTWNASGRRVGNQGGRRLSTRLVGVRRNLIE